MSFIVLDPDLGRQNIATLCFPVYAKATVGGDELLYRARAGG